MATTARAATTATAPPATPIAPHRSAATVLPAALAAAGVLAQVAYPLLDGAPLRAATVLVVVLLAAAAVAHAAAAHGTRAAAAVLATAGGIGLAAEATGVATGVPFGAYDYADTLGPKVLGVPLVVPLAWTMLAYPCLLLGRRLAARAGRTGRTARREAVTTALAGGLALAAWDLFLDPQMVADGHWTWHDPAPALPGVPGVPLTNYAGWVAVAVAMVAALDRVLPRSAPTSTAPGRAEAVPAAVLAWTWAGSTLGNLAFFGRPWVALYGGLAMGALVVPYLLSLRRREPGAGS
jgi:putative membrane protein